MTKLAPLLVLALLAVVLYIGYCLVTRKPIVGLVGYSPYSSSPMPSSPAGSSHVFGMSVQAR